jgi:hypothetical protein
MRKVLVAIVLLVLLGVVADRVAESVAEDRLVEVAEEEAARYDVRSSGGSAEIGGFGFLPQLAGEDFSRVTLTMQRPTFQSVQAQDLTVAMTGIHVPRSLLTGDTTATVNVDAAELRLRLSPEALTTLGALDAVSLRIVNGNLQARVAGVAATVRPEVRNGRLRLVLDDQVPSAIRSLLADGIKIPDLPFDASLKQAAVDGQFILLTAAATDIELSRS